MLRRDRQIRMQIHQLMDACLFAVGFWLAYELRSNQDIIDLFDLVAWNRPFETYVPLYLVLIPAAPLMLEGQGFYARPPFCSRSTTAWMLFKGCFFTSLGLVLTMYLFRMPPGRPLGGDLVRLHQLRPGVRQGGDGAVGWREPNWPRPSTGGG